MFKLLVFACLLAFAVAVPKPLATYYNTYLPGVGSAYTAYSNYPAYNTYAGGYYGSYGYGAYPYSGSYY